MTRNNAFAQSIKDHGVGTFGIILRRLWCAMAIWTRMWKAKTEKTLANGKDAIIKWVLSANVPSDGRNSRYALSANRIMSRTLPIFYPLSIHYASVLQVRERIDLRGCICRGVAYLFYFRHIRSAVRMQRTKMEGLRVIE